MIVYSVTVSVEAQSAAEWLDWMLEIHIPEVMETGFFEEFRVHKLLEPTPEDDSVTFNIQYDCLTLAHYELYREQHAPRLQAAHNERFAGRMAAFRTLLERF